MQPKNNDGDEFSMWIDLANLLTSSEVESKLQQAYQGGDFILAARIKKTNYIRSNIYNARIKPQYWRDYSNGGNISLVTTAYDYKDGIHEEVYLNQKDFYLSSTIHPDRNMAPSQRKALFIQAFDELDWYMDHEGVYLSTDEKYHNGFHGIIIEQERLPLLSFLKEKTNVKAYAGMRQLEEETNEPDDVTDELLELFTRWDCVESEKIQAWYYANNSEYRMQYDAISVKSEVYYDTYDDVYFTNMPIDKVKEVVKEYHSTFMVPQDYFGHRQVDVQFLHGYDYFDHDSYYENDKDSDESDHFQQDQAPIFYEPTDEMKERMHQESMVRWEYANKRKAFEADSYEDYDDYQYFERLRNGEE